MAASGSKKLKLTHSWEDGDKCKAIRIRADALDASEESWEDDNSENDDAWNIAVHQKGSPKPPQKIDLVGQASLYSSTGHKLDTFKLQIGEMLQEICPTYDQQVARVDATLRKLKHTIENLPERGPSTVAEAEKELSKEDDIRIPFPEPLPDMDANYTFTYAKPANINVVGSYPRKTAVRVNGQLTVDLAVTMPTKIFQEKDYLNYRYFYKRAYYLARIAVGIRASKDINFHVEFALQNDNHLQPIIMVTSNQNSGGCDLLQSRCQIRILSAADGELFPQAKTMPDKSCLRSHCALQDAPSGPTPFYNASLRSECCSFSNLRLLHDASSQSNSFKDACLLGSIWLRQRGFGAGLTHGGFGPFEWACTVALLMRGGGPKDKPVLSKKYNSHQIFKATLLYLSMKDLMLSPVLIGEGTIETSPHEGPILFSGAQGLNILFKMAPWSYTLLRHEASRTLKLLNDPYTDKFDACFITRLCDPMRRFDCVATFHLSGTRQFTTPPPITDAYDDLTQYCLVAYRALKRGLDDRAFLVNLQRTAPSSWAIAAAKSKASQTDKVLVGLFLNPKHLNRTVDQGPAATEKEAASSFRTFWGEKAELRRFKDGVIRESLIWSTSSNQSVLAQLLAYILRRHLGREAAGSLSMLGNTFDLVLPSEGMGDPVALYQPLMNAYEILEKQIRAMEGMPLQVRHISAADAQLRYSSLGVPRLDSIQSQQTEPANVYVQFEGSSRWPDDLAAVQRTKITFLLKLGETLESSASESSVFTRLGLENQTSILSNVAFLDVNYASGAFFRLRIYHEGELTLLERAMASASPGASREAIALGLSAHKRNFVQLPLHTQAVRTLSTRFPLLSPSIRLMKKWRNSQLLSYHISDELVELLTIRSFVQSYPWAVPGSAVTGFLRTLTFISRWDWRFDPLIVNFSGEMDMATYNTINTRFKAWRQIDPAMNRIAMFVASNQDPEGILCTETGPSKVVAARLTSLARAACAVVEEQGMDLQASALFTSSLADYDFVVHLNPNFAKGNLGRNEQKRGAFKNIWIQEQQDKYTLLTKVVRSFLDELRTLYGSNVIFFYNENGGSLIGGVWNPLTGLKSWKVNVGYSTVPIKQVEGGNSQLTLNKAGTLHDIAKLGRDLILKIEERQ